VKALVAMGIGPEEIESAARAASPIRLFERVPSVLSANGFLAAVHSKRHERGKRFDATRFFCEEHELLRFAGWTYALTNQWGPWTAATIEEVLRAFPDYGVVVRRRVPTE
jgi:hypothetical protein